MLESIVNLSDTPGKKFQSLADNLNKLAPIIQQGEAQFGILGLVAKVEGLLKSEIQNYLGIKTFFTTEKSGGYLAGVSIAGPYPVMTLKRRFSIDIINSAKRGDVKPVINNLKKEIVQHVKDVRAGLTESESNREYIIFEVEAPVSGDSLGTLASFKGVMPVDKLSLVDTDKERDFVPKEIKKDNFILKPVKGNVIYNGCENYLQVAVVNALLHKGLSESQLKNYLHIARSGNYKIIKEHISESANYEYRKLGNTITLSNIRYR